MKLLTEIILLLGLYTFVSIVWQGLELIIIGEIQPRTIDAIIGLVLAMSLYFNLRN